MIGVQVSFVFDPSQCHFTGTIHCLTNVLVYTLTKCGTFINSLRLNHSRRRPHSHVWFGGVDKADGQEIFLINIHYYRGILDKL